MTYTMNRNDDLTRQQEELETLRWQLQEANDAIDAIRTGQVDALVLRDEAGPQLYTLKSADQTYRTFIERMKEGAVTLDDEGLVLYSNSAFADIVKLPLTKVIGWSFNQFLADESKNGFLDLYDRSWDIETKGEVCLVDSQGRELPAWVSLSKMEVDGEMAIAIIITDLTLPKESEKLLKLKNAELEQARADLEKLNDQLEERVELRTRELMASREYFKFLADNIPVIMWTATPDGQLDYFNKRWYIYSGMTERDNMDDSFQDAIHPNDLERTLSLWRESLTTGNDYHIEYRLRRASDATYRWHTVTGLPLKDDQGRILKWFGISSDVEEQKIALARKDDFISMASHELKTPVTILKAFAQVLSITLEEEGNSKALAFTSKINGQIGRLAQLITELLDATKVNAGVQILLDKKSFDFNELVSETVDELQLTTKSHKLEKQLSATVCVNGDRERLGQVISNLIVNAIKYSPAANKIIIASEVKSNSVVVYVRDFGIGIPLAQQSQLFNRFFRADGNNTNTFPGLGLGLYISNEIIKLHSGKLEFESEEGKGSTFIITLPVCVD